MLESPKFIDNDNYQGSRAFTWLADICGLSVDLVAMLDSFGIFMFHLDLLHALSKMMPKVG